MPKRRESKTISKAPKPEKGAKARALLEKKEFQRRRDMLMTSCITNAKKDVVEDEEFKKRHL